ncbi:MAG: hypothetical protein GY865_07580 [candidate division Zixibacteria bacterium]|nr:hypothetical protein [candidate division Zixibacteria bacterium]
MQLLKIMIIGIFAAVMITGCSQEDAYVDDTADQAPGLVVKAESPAPMDAPVYIEPKSDTDWEARVSNKNAEIIGVLNIINPVASYIIAAFEQYADKLGEVTHEEWEDTGAQLGRANAIYDDCKKRMAAKKFDKKLFLDLEEAWQVYVKVGVAGVRTKSMIDNDLSRAS